MIDWVYFFSIMGNSRKGKAFWAGRTLVFGIGINDYQGIVGEAGKGNIKSYTAWKSVLMRCYDERYHAGKPTYIGCSMSDEWKYFSKFKEWYDSNYRDGYQLDKDILTKGNKIYSAETCCFVPKEINMLCRNNNANKGECPSGINKQKRDGKFMARFSMNGERKYLGTFGSMECAFDAYRKAKRLHFKKTAMDYFHNDKITYRVYLALINWEVSIGD